MTSLKSLIISHSDYQGGAARAAYRLLQCLLIKEPKTRMLAGTKGSGDWRVTGPKSNFEDVLARVRGKLEFQLSKLQGSSNQVLHSPGLIGSKAIHIINNCDADLINLHWVNNGFLSIKQIGDIKKPIVWTLHDMWPFCGAEHYADDESYSRWRVGYTSSNRSMNSTLLDIDRFSWNLKSHYWKNNFHIISPSDWLAKCAKESVLFRNANITTIPNPLDLSVFKPISTKFSRDCLNLPQDKKLILFGALGGSKDPRKGWDLLYHALKSLAINRSDIQAVIFGQNEPEYQYDLGMPIRWFGHITDDQTLALLYNSADLMVVPSRQENLPQSATEAQACGCPVVAFNTCGLSSAVEHLNSGFLANKMSSIDLKIGIDWILNLSNEDFINIRSRCRDRAEMLWNYDLISTSYTKFFNEAIRCHK